MLNILGGHPWVFSGAIESIEPGLDAGSLCELYSKKQFLGIGYYNPHTNIALRILSRSNRMIDKSFFVERFSSLKADRERFVPDSNAWRLVFGESDNLPGLVVDNYNGCLVIQIHTAGMEQLKTIIVEALVDVCEPRVIFERSDLASRKQEGLPQESVGLLYGEDVEEVEINENGFRFSVNIQKGQKTGFFLDQRENRLALLRYTSGLRVLNCFSYTGGFSVYAASNAAYVASVDISAKAIDNAKLNFSINGYNVNNYGFFARDVFEVLSELKPGEYDMIILDPPSFAKNRTQLQNAIKAYITINSKALEKINDYGILVSSSCTTHVDEITFIKILHQSAINARCQIKVIESRCQPVDHPYNLSYPEGRYLKFFVLLKLPLV